MVCVKSIDPIGADIEDLVNALSSVCFKVISSSAASSVDCGALCRREKNAFVTTIPELGWPASPANCELEQNLEYLYKRLIYVNDITPSDQFDRRKWVKGMQVFFSHYGV